MKRDSAAVRQRRKRADNRADAEDIKSEEIELQSRDVWN